MIEAIAISTVGGCIGTIAGVCLAALAAVVFGFPFIVAPWSVIVGFGLSFVLGLLAGVIPASNAAKLDPIVALRSD